MTEYTQPFQVHLQQTGTQDKPYWVAQLSPYPYEEVWDVPYGEGAKVNQALYHLKYHVTKSGLPSLQMWSLQTFTLY